MRAQGQGWLQRLEELHLSGPFRVVAILLAAWVVTLLLKLVVKRVLRRTFELPGVDKTRADARQRAVTAALRSALVGVVWALAAITVVSEFGVNIGAFVATATVIGGAVAFGAQQLMRDLIAGFFVLVEDQYGVGDEIDLGLASGTVERMSLRSVRLRDSVGGVWYVPHGGVARVGNLSKASAAAVDLEVARACRRTELDAVAADLCAALAADPQVDGMLAAEPQAVGIIDVRDDRLIYRLRVATYPGRHALVTRRWRLLVLDAFDDGRLAAPAPKVL